MNPLTVASRPPSAVNGALYPWFLLVFSHIYIQTLSRPRICDVLSRSIGRRLTAVKKKSTTKKKVATKKAPVKKKTAARKTATPKAAAPKAAAANTKPIANKQTKTQIIAAISEETGLNKKEVGAVFASLGNLVQRHMKKRGSGEFTIPETGVKVRRQRKPATKSRKMVSPFTGEPITVKAKPARNVVKVTALKALKESVTK